MGKNQKGNSLVMAKEIQFCNTLMDMSAQQYFAAAKHEHYYSIAELLVKKCLF